MSSTLISSKTYGLVSKLTLPVPALCPSAVQSTWITVQTVHAPVPLQAKQILSMWALMLKKKKTCSKGKKDHFERNARKRIERKWESSWPCARRAWPNFLPSWFLLWLPLRKGFLWKATGPVQKLEWQNILKCRWGQKAWKWSERCCVEQWTPYL